MVFSHKCIPLTVLLREEKQERKKDDCDDGQQFLELLSEISNSLRTGHTIGDDVSWTHRYGNLFTTKIRGRTLNHHSVETIICVLRERTYWYRRLKPNMRLMVKHLVRDNKLLQLKEILHVADGVICQLLVSYPEVLVGPIDNPYKVTDGIANSIISSALLNYQKILKEIKAFRKSFRKAAFEKRPYEIDNLRSMSWAVPIVKQYNETYHINSREKMFRVCTFAQARCTGLADKKMVESTINEFVDAVSHIRPFEPDDDMLKAIEEVTTRISFDAAGYSAHFRASMSTSACRESSKKKDGKFGHLRELLKRNELPVPEFPNPDTPGGMLGTPIWHKALRMAKARDENLLKVNVAGIRENGKCRVVTSGSFYKDALLQPFSHLTIEMAKALPELKQGFTAGRLGWEFIRLLDSNDPLRGDILFEDEVSGLSFDFKKATDAPSHAAGRAVMTPILQKIGLDDETIEALLFAWIGDQHLFRNKKLVGMAVNGIPMGNPLTKTMLSLVHPICSYYARIKVGRRITVIGTGNGDDGNQIAAGSERYEYFRHFLAGASMLGYDESQDDTFITDDWMTYCEEVFRIPVDRFHVVKNAVRVGDSRISPYLDHPRGRLVLDTKKDRQDFSSTPQGKYTLMGKDLEYVSKDATNGINFLFAVSSACQDICLGLSDRTEPVTLPRQIYGTGKPPSKWNVVSWFNAIVNSRKWARYCTVATMKELIGERPPHYTNLRGVMRDQPHFKNESVLEVLRIPEDDPIKKYRVIKQDDWEKFPAGVIDKLIMGGRLVRESKLSGQYLFHQRMCGILEERKDLFEVARTMTDEILEFHEDDILATIKKFRKKYYNRQWTLRSVMNEDLYWPNIVSIMADADPLKVNLDLKYLDRFGHRPRSDTPHERRLDELEAWFVDNLHEILEGRSASIPPRDILADDDLIMLEIDRTVELIILLISDDNKLGFRAGRQFLDKVIFQVSCRDWVFHSADATKFEKEIKSLVGKEPHIIIDTGSLETFLETTGATYSMGIPVADPLIRKWNEDVPKRKAPAQAEIYSRWRIRPEITAALLRDIIQVRSPRNAATYERIRSARVSE